MPFIPLKLSGQCADPEIVRENFNKIMRVLPMRVDQLTITGSGTDEDPFVAHVGGSGDTGGGSGDSDITIYTGDDSIISDRTVNLNGKILTFSDAGGSSLILNPVTNLFNYNALVHIFNTVTSIAGDIAGFTGGIGVSDGIGAIANLDFAADSVGNNIVFYLVAFGGAGGTTSIGGSSTIGSIEYDALTHTFFGRLFGLVQPSDDFANDAAAAVGGVPVLSYYHTAGVVKIRLT